jgi:hypothetical protein
VRSGDGYVEVGVVSWGYGDSPNVYARVSAYRDYTPITLPSVPVVMWCSGAHFRLGACWRLASVLPRYSLVLLCACEIANIQCRAQQGELETCEGGVSCRFIPYDSVRHPGPRPDRSGSSKDPPRCCLDPAAGSWLLFCWLAGWLAGWSPPRLPSRES